LTPGQSTDTDDGYEKGSYLSVDFLRA